MSTSTIILGAVGITAAWYWDSRSWKRKPREELVRMLQSDDWRFYKPAISELRRRGDDVTAYLPAIVPLLASDSKVERAAAQMVINDCFPELASAISGYSPAADVALCRELAAPLISKFPRHDVVA